MSICLAYSARARWPRALVLIVVVVSASWFTPTSARAGGLYLMPRGVEASARGGARVAGADDPGSLWYNPAGLIRGGKQLLVDFTLPIVQTEFTRVLDNGTREPTVSATNQLIPIPTIAYSDSFGLRNWAFGAGLLIPTGYVPNWPSSVEVDGERQRAPQRYSVLNTDGSAIASLALGAAFQPAKIITVGATLMLTAASLGAEVAVSACDYAVCSQPEGREWEGRTRFLLGPVYTATAVLGSTLDLDIVRIGASAMLPTKISGEAEFDVRLPDQQFFDGVSVESKNGSKDLIADMDLRLPAILRLGVEVLPMEALKVEIGATYETWSVQDSITVRPKNVLVKDVPGIGTVEAQPVTLARNMRDTWAINLGGKYALAAIMPKHRPLDISAGAMFETGAFDDRDLSPTTIDTRKLLLGIGASVEVWPGVMLDATYGHIFMQNRNVRDSQVLLPAAIRPQPRDNDPDSYDVGDRPAIGNGDYVVEADFVGLGVRWMLDDWARARAPKTTPPPPSAAPPAPPPAATEPAPAAVTVPPAAASEPAPSPVTAPPAAPAPASGAVLPPAQGTPVAPVETLPPSSATPTLIPPAPSSLPPPGAPAPEPPAPAPAAPAPAPSVAPITP